MLHEVLVTTSSSGGGAEKMDPFPDIGVGSCLLLSTDPSSGFSSSLHIFLKQLEKKEFL